MGLKVTNNAFGTLNAGITSSSTTIVLNSGEGARFPTLGAGDYFYATLIDTSNNLEIVKVTARSTDTMTIVRAQDNTTARAYSTNDRFELRPTAALFNEKVNKAGDTMTGGLTLGGQLNLGSTGQIVFPATQSASTDPNTLDDYEEGTWTPTITSESGTFTSVTASGTYTKIGRVVSIQTSITISNAGTAGGSLRFTLPFSATGSKPSVGAGREAALTGNMLQILSTGTIAVVFTYTNGSPITTGHQLICSLTYITTN